MGWVLIGVLIAMLGPGIHLAELLVVMALWGPICLILGLILWERKK